MDNYSKHIKIVVEMLYNSIIDSNISSYDPFDALKSPISSTYLFNKFNLISRLFIKINNISPINIRIIFGIKKTKNDPKVLADLIQSLFILNNNKKNNLQYNIKKYVEMLISENTILENNHLGWGLKFPYSSRYVKNANMPNLFTTVNCAYALIKTNTYNYIKQDYFDRINELIFKDLGVIEIDSDKCFLRYYVGLNEAIYNVNSLAVKYLINYSAVYNCNKVATIAQKIVNFIISSQNENGSWYYSSGKKGKWIDGYHTGYILEGLIECYNVTKNEEVLKAIKKGGEYYIGNLLNDNFPLLFPRKKYPIDSQNCSQAIQTRCYLNSLNFDSKLSIMDMVDKIEKKLLKNNKQFIYQKTILFSNFQFYLRWCVSPFLLAYCNLLLEYND